MFPRHDRCPARRCRLRRPLCPGRVRDPRGPVLRARAAGGRVPARDGQGAHAGRLGQRRDGHRRVGVVQRGRRQPLGVDERARLLRRVLRLARRHADRPADGQAHDRDHRGGRPRGRVGRAARRARGRRRGDRHRAPDRGRHPGAVGGAGQRAGGRRRARVLARRGRRRADGAARAAVRRRRPARPRSRARCSVASPSAGRGCCSVGGSS